MSHKNSRGHCSVRHRLGRDRLGARGARGPQRPGRHERGPGGAYDRLGPRPPRARPLQAPLARGHAGPLHLPRDLRGPAPLGARRATCPSCTAAGARTASSGRGACSRSRGCTTPPSAPTWCSALGGRRPSCRTGLPSPTPRSAPSGSGRGSSAGRMAGGETSSESYLGAYVGAHGQRGPHDRRHHRSSRADQSPALRRR